MLDENGHPGREYETWKAGDPDPGIVDNSEIAKYDTEPLPFQSVNDAGEKLIWSDFAQDESGMSIYLYRGLSGVDSSMVKGEEHLASGARGKTKEELYSALNSIDHRETAKLDTLFTTYNSATLHTTRSKSLAKGIAGDQGLLITYKIPKQWLVEEGNRPVLGNIGEAELDFFHSLPEEFVDHIDQFGNNLPVIHIEEDVNDGFSTMGDSHTIKDIPPPPAPPDLN